MLKHACRFYELRVFEMQRRVKFVLITCLAFAMVAIAVVAAMSRLEIFVFTENLHVEGFRSTSGDANTTDVYQNGVTISNIYIMTGAVNPQTGLIPIIFSIWHLENTELDSLHLRFSATNPMQIYLSMPEGNPWPPIDFHHDLDGKSIIFGVKDLGFMGSGTIMLDFMIRPWQSQTSFRLEIEYTLHFPALLQLTHQAVSTQIEIPIQWQSMQ